MEGGSIGGSVAGAVDFPAVGPLDEGIESFPLCPFPAGDACSSWRRSAEKSSPRRGSAEGSRAPRRSALLVSDQRTLFGRSSSGQLWGKSTKEGEGK
ncbi:hypothetical protein KM043_001775 [Ampulex compressa]|nr:hypothetical protein KM043_001775 [Ampulex compressa]